MQPVVGAQHQGARIANMRGDNARPHDRPAQASGRGTIETTSETVCRPIASRGCARTPSTAGTWFTSDLKNDVIVPDTLIHPHSASLQTLFYTGARFPAEYKANVFAADHGSWTKPSPAIRSFVPLLKMACPLENTKISTGQPSNGFPIKSRKIWTTKPRVLARWCTPLK
jgi:hypothetical protein